MKRVVWAVLALSSILAIVPGCRRTPAQSDLVRIGYLAIANSLPLYVAMDSGLFEEEGIRVELTKFETSNDLIEALVAGRIDAEFSASTPAMLAMEVRSPGQFKVFSVNVQTLTRAPDCILVHKDSEIRTIADLRGMKIGTFPGSTFLSTLRAVLEPELSMKDVAVEQIPPPAQVEALRARTVSAIYTLEPFVTLAETKGDGRVLLAAAAEKKIMSPLPAGLSAVSSAFVAARPKTVTRLLAVSDEAIELVRMDEAKARAALPNYTPLDAEMAGRIRLVDYWKSPEIDTNALSKYIDFLVASGDLKQRVDPATLLLAR